MLPATMVGRQEKFLKSRRSRMAKTVTFWTLVSLLIVSALKLYFFPLFPSLLLCKKMGRGGGGEINPQHGRQPCRHSLQHGCQTCDIITEICKPLT